MRQLEQDEILRCFPFAEVRGKQRRSCEFIARAINRGFRDIVVAAPTGVGKTGIGVAVCEWAATSGASELAGYRGGYYLTVQKILQSQIEHDFDVRKFKGVGASIKAAAEYGCPRARNCGLGSRLKNKCDRISEGSCTYRQAKAKFIAAHTAITNYPFLFAEHKYVGKLETRKVVVCDEAHSLERQLIRFNDLAVGQSHVEKWVRTNVIAFPRLRRLNEFVDWIEKVYLSECADKLAEMFSFAERGDDKFAKECVDLEQHICKTKRAVELIRSDPQDWIYWTEKDREGKPVSVARPLNAAPFMPDLIQDMASVRVYMSAFPGPKEIWCRNLGLDPDTVAWLTLNSPFAVENRQIIACGTGSMSMRNVDDSFPSFMRLCTMILDAHQDEKGIIHCNSYALGSRIIDALRGSPHAARLVFPTNADEREQAFSRHSTSTNTVIISPSMTEGFDFADDLARWQIIAKVPYPSLGDAQVVAKKEQDEEWYSLQTIMTIVQASGRICRNELDTGITYILDADFRRLFDRFSYMFPNWWTEALTWKMKST